MPTLLKIIVTNNQDNPNQFFFFQKPAVYLGGAQIYTNSIYHRNLQSKDKGGQIEFKTNLQYSAAVQESDTSDPKVGHSSGYETASQAIDLAAKDNTPQTHDCATMFYDTPTDSLGLSVPVNDPAVQEGAFRIRTAKYGPAKHFKVGSAVNVNGVVILSKFVLA